MCQPNQMSKIKILRNSWPKWSGFMTIRYKTLVWSNESFDFRDSVDVAENGSSSRSVRNIMKGNFGDQLAGALLIRRDSDWSMRPQVCTYNSYHSIALENKGDCIL